MSCYGKELEVKFYVSDLARYEDHIQRMGAKCIQPRTYEYNLRFDNALGELTQKFQVLRLRKDTACKLTFKGPGSNTDEVYARPEIELAVSNFDDTKALLEALGFQVSMIYEKFRTIYDTNGVFVTLDEMPYGNFIEIEGLAGNLIKDISLKLGLKWECRILESYDILFQKARKSLGIKTINLLFSSFSAIVVTPDQMGIRSADE